MKRTEFLNTEETKATTINSLVSKEIKFLNRTIQALEDKIEDAEESLKERLMEPVSICASDVEVTYRTILDIKAQKELYENFRKEYYAENN